MGGANDPCEAAGIIESDGPGLVFRNVGELATPMSLSNVLAALSVSGGGMGSAAEQMRFSNPCLTPLMTPAWSTRSQTQPYRFHQD